MGAAACLRAHYSHARLRLAVARSVGVVGILASFSILCSVLTLASGAVLVATMGSFNDAQAIALGRKAACSAPHHGMNLAIAALVFGLLELIGYVTLYAELVALVIVGNSFDSNGRRLQNNAEEATGYGLPLLCVALDSGDWHIYPLPIPPPPSLLRAATSLPSTPRTQSRSRCSSPSSTLPSSLCTARWGSVDGRVPTSGHAAHWPRTL